MRESLAAVHRRHVEIEQHDVGLDLLDELDAFKAVGSLAHHLEVVLAGEQRLEATAKQRVVVNQGDANLLVTLLRTGFCFLHSSDFQ